MAVLRPLQGRARELPGGRGDRARRAVRPREARRSVAQGAPVARALHRAGRLRGDAAEGMVPPRAGAARCACGTACLIKCKERREGRTGEVVELRCTWDPESRGGAPADGRKVKGTLHWVSATRTPPGRGAALRPPLLGGEPARRTRTSTYKTHLNPKSLETLGGVPRRAEPREREAARPRPVRAARLLLRRPRLDPAPSSSSTGRFRSGTRGRRRRGRRTTRGREASSGRRRWRRKAWGVP